MWLSHGGIMVRKLATVSVTAVAALAMLFAAGGASAEPAKLGKKAPDFTLKDHNGKEVKLADYKGKTVVLEWINPGCPYVKRHYEAGTMVNLAKEHAKGGEVVWLALNSSDGAKAADMKAFAEKNKLPYPILMDSDGKVGKAYGAKTTPHMFIIDKEGNLAYTGGIDNDEDGEKSSDRQEYVKSALDELKAGKAVSVAETKSYGCGIKYK
jgi:peroxiredoxin